MNRTARQLINRAMRETRAFRFGEALPGDLANEALDILNDFLASLEGSPHRIPYYTEVSFNLLQGKNIYTVSKEIGADVAARKIIEIESCQALLSTVWFNIQYLDIGYYDTSMKLSALKSRPRTVFLQNDTYGSTLYFYPTPNIDYPCTIKCKQVFDTLEMDDRLDEMPNAMWEYATLELARRLAPFYGIALDADQMKRLKEMEGNLRRLSNKNPTVMKPGPNVHLTAYERADSGF